MAVQLPAASFRQCAGPWADPCPVGRCGAGRVTEVTRAMQYQGSYPTRAPQTWGHRGATSKDACFKGWLSKHICSIFRQRKVLSGCLTRKIKIVKKKKKKKESFLWQLSLEGAVSHGEHPGLRGDVGVAVSCRPQRWEDGRGPRPQHPRGPGSRVPNGSKLSPLDINYVLRPWGFAEEF